ncbi:heterokaryon incompatibility protein-domain-containing protein, partial [Earliella scabrosa]
MRLLHTTDGSFKDYSDPPIATYAILSHVWAKEGMEGYPEKTYQDVLEAQTKSKKSRRSVFSHLRSKKIEQASRVTKAHGVNYIWIDSCCIDKTNGPELSEAINSMYQWYGQAKICYAFLDDVIDPTDSTMSVQPLDDAVATDEAQPQTSPGTALTDLQYSGWFRRGWTLQELIAPREVLFLSRSWSLLGSKHTLGPRIAGITGISIDVLRNERAPHHVPIADHMSWADRRETTKKEDMAYCLIGLFKVTMALKYGEGNFAFIRLQRAIMKRNPDQSILAW